MTKDRQPHHAETETQHAKGPPLWEQVVGSVGMVIILAIVGFMIYQGFNRSRPPELIAEPIQVIAQRAGYLVEIRLTNEGDLTASQVTVTGTLLRNDSQASIETSDTTFDFVPPHSSRQGTLIFQHDPETYHLVLQIKSYNRP